ncbi:1,3,6,8-tetrahydroxynaphthalene synthase [Deinococcus carri]|uniref:1,3,6,8-tetrahydroxynaphthalene synthase n=2 Tax=Deinococcus TaxID=1298 RepID=A0ABP9XJH4_9DEIO
MHANILGVGTAVPAHTIAQTSVRDRARTHFTGLSDASRERLLRIYENTGIERRFWVNDVEWYTTQRPFDERNAQWHEQALDMAEEASRAALAAAGVEASQVQAVVMVTTSGIATPSPEAYLIQRLGIPLSATRLPIWGLGCAGGAAGLARGAELATLRPKGCVLVVAVELCSLTFNALDHSTSNVVASSLFADGAAAVVLGHEGGPEIVGSFTRMLPESYDVMGWDVVPEGLRVRFASSIPNLLRGELGNLIRDGLAEYGLSQDDVGLWVLHPGGAKVLTAYEEALEAAGPSLEASAHVLRHYGNMSSPTVLFVLQHLLQQGQVQPGTNSVLLALGPGFAAEGVIIRW